MANCLKSQEPGVRSAALKCLASNAPQESFSHILSGTKDKDYNVRWTSFELMGQVKDPRSIKHLIERINGADSRQVNATLAKFGSSVEEYVVAMLSDSSVSTRQAACTLLSKIGTKTGLVSLKRMIMKEDSLRVRLYASDAIDTIQRRIKLEGLLSH